MSTIAASDVSVGDEVMWMGEWRYVLAIEHVPFPSGVVGPLLSFGDGVDDCAHFYPDSQVNVVEP